MKTLNEALDTLRKMVEDNSDNIRITLDEFNSPSLRKAIELFRKAKTTADDFYLTNPLPKEFRLYYRWSKELMLSQRRAEEKKQRILDLIQSLRTRQYTDRSELRNEVTVFIRPHALRADESKEKHIVTDEKGVAYIRQIVTRSRNSRVSVKATPDGCVLIYRAQTVADLYPNLAAYMKGKKLSEMEAAAAYSEAWELRKRLAADYPIDETIH